MSRVIFFACVLVALAAGDLTASEGPRAILLQGFESVLALGTWPPNSPSRAQISTDWCVEGQSSLKIGPELAVSLDSLATHDLRGFGLMRLVVNNPSEETIQVGFTLHDQHHNYWDRHLSAFGVAPGVHVVDMSIAPPLWRSEQNRPFRGAAQEDFDLGQVTRLGLYNHGDQAIFVDRVEAVAPQDLSVQGAVAFDFGPPRSPVSVHWTGVSPQQLYTPGADFGLAASGGHALHQFMAYPTPALGDGVAWPEAGFAVDLGGGAYRGWVAFERGGFWGGEAASYLSATLTCNSTAVHQHSYSRSGVHFLFQDTEITDWSQVADRLIWPAHAIATFSFVAREGANVFQLATTGAQTPRTQWATSSLSR